MSRRIVICVLLVIALLATACGGDSETTTDADPPDQPAAADTDADPPDQPTVDDADAGPAAACAEFVATVEATADDPEPVRQAAIAGNTLADSLEDAGDVPVLAVFFEAIRKGLVEVNSSGDHATAILVWGATAVVAGVADASDLPECRAAAEAVHPRLQDLGLGPTQSGDPVQAALAACESARALSVLPADILTRDSAGLFVSTDLAVVLQSWLGEVEALRVEAGSLDPTVAPVHEALVAALEAGIVWDLTAARRLDGDADTANAAYFAEVNVLDDAARAAGVNCFG